MKRAENQQLLRDYIQTGSEVAFRALVESYLGLVFGVARRMMADDSHKAQDVAQIVFADLARKARTLSDEPMLGGWLHRHTCYVASTLLRTERRRQERERVAMEINELNRDTDSSLSQAAPVLDAAINELDAADRAAIILRYFEQQDFGSVGDAIGTTEDAARMRVNRALEKLQLTLRRKGFTLPATAIAAGLTAEATAMVPAGMTATIAGAALAHIPTTGSIPLVITMTKLKALCVATVVAAAAGTPMIMQHASLTRLRAEKQSLAQRLAGSVQLQAENQRLSKELDQQTSLQRNSEEQMRELLRLRAAVGHLRQEHASPTGQPVEGNPGTLSAARATVVPPLYTRTIKVDIATIREKLGKSTASNAASDPLRQLALREFLKANGIEFAPPATIYLHETRGELTVRTSLADLDKIEMLLDDLMALAVPDRQPGATQLRNDAPGQATAENVAAAKALLDNGQIDEAEAAFKKLITQDPNSPAAYEYLNEMSEIRYKQQH